MDGLGPAMSSKALAGSLRLPATVRHILSHERSRAACVQNLVSGVAAADGQKHTVMTVVHREANTPSLQYRTRHRNLVD